MKNILIIGVNGFMGCWILNDLLVNFIYYVIGCLLRDDICFGKDYCFVCIDIWDENEVWKLFKECWLDIVINIFVFLVLDYCEIYYVEVEVINVIVVEMIVYVCEQYGSCFIYFFMDFVFDGKSIWFYKEEDEVILVNYYGVMKLKVEKIIVSICSNYVIVCVVVVYGKVFLGQYGNIFQLVVNWLRNGEMICVVFD